MGPIPPILITKLCCFLWHVATHDGGAPALHWPVPRHSMRMRTWVPGRAAAQSLRADGDSQALRAPRASISCSALHWERYCQL